MKQKSVGMTLRVLIIALALSLVAGSPALPPFDGVAYAQSTTGLTATLTPANAVSLTWTAVDGADSYEVWRGDGKGSTVQWGSSAHATVTAPAVTYTDSSVMAGNTYSYAVRAVTGGTPASFMGPYPNVEIPSSVAKPTARPTVTVTAVDGDNTAVDVSWTSVATATSYEIGFWHSGLDDWDYDLPAQTSMSYRHTGLMAGTEYYYVVRGVNDGGMGPWSRWQEGTSKITLQATSATPTLSLDHQSRTVVVVSWTPAPAGSRYELERRRVVTATDNTATPPTTAEVAASTTAFADVSSELLTETSYTDRAANFVAPADTATAVHRVMYEYRVRAVDTDDQEGDWSAVKSVEIPRSGAVLGAPTGLSAAVLSSSNIRVTWNSVAGADYYELQWKSGDRSFSTSIRVNRPDSGNPTYNDTGLTPSTKYTYRVRGVDINGPGDWSAEVSMTTLSVTAEAGQMPKVTGLTVTDMTTSNAADARVAKLTWNAVSTATDYEIQRYDPSTADGWGDLAGTAGAVTRIDAAASPSHTDTFSDGSAAGKTYFYVVSAVEDGVDDDPAVVADNEMGEWSDHKGVTFKAHKPADPTALMGAKTSATSILVSWTAPNAVPTSGEMRGLATSYTLRWKASDSQTWRDIAVTGTSYHHTGLRGSTSYTYRLRAQNSGGESGWVDLTGDDPVVLGNTLSPPTGLRAVDASTDGADAADFADDVYRIKVSWGAVTGADSYEIQRFADDDDTWGNLADTTLLVTAVSGTEVTDDLDGNTTGLAANTTYLYRVRTVKEGATSGWSATVSGMTRAVGVAAPTLVATSTGMSMIRLSWTAVAGATGYEIEFLKGSYADNTAFGAANLNRSKIMVSGGSHRHYVHTGRTAGTRYSYRIKAMLAQGGDTGWSAPAQQYTKPARPVLSASSTISTTMVLSWDAVSFVTSAGAANRLTTTPATNYQIQRRLANSREWTTLDLTATTGAAASCTNNKCTFTDGATDATDAAALKASTRYYYRIRATVTQDGGTYTSYWAYRNQQTSN